MDHENPQILMNNLFFSDIATPLDCLIRHHHEEQEQNQEHKIMKQQPISKKGRPKGLKNNSQRIKRQKKEIPNIDLKKGHWLKEQNKRYHWFLEIYNKHFINKHLRRMDKIFKTMAIFIGTRQAQQCRSHHQKMEKKYHTFFKIIHYLRNSFYNTCAIQPLQQDLYQNNLSLIDGLISENTVLQNLHIIETKSQNQQVNYLISSYEEQAIAQNESQFKAHILLDEDYSKNFLNEMN